MNLHELIDQLLANSWRAGILIATLFAVRGSLRRFMDARIIYWFWVLVTARLLLPFDLPAPVSAAPYFPPAPWTYALEYDPAPSVSAAAPAVPNSFVFPAARSLGEILFNEKTLAIVWLGGVVAVLLAHSWANLSFRRQLSRTGRRAGKRTEQMVSGCSQAMGLNPIPAVEMDGISGPALFGVWRARLLFPVGLAEQLSDEELRLVVLHELGHLKRRDLFLQGLLVVSQAVHWFNPLVWLAGRLAREDRELACDEFVMAHTSNSGGHAYAKTLLRVLGLSRPGRPMLPAIGILETKNQLKQRILMIQNYQSTNARRLVLGAASILAVSAGLLMASDTGSNAPATASAAVTETSPPATPNKILITPAAKKVFKIGDGIEIKEVLGSVPNFQVGGTYRVKGVCRQQTLDKAQLYMGNTVESTGEGDVGQNAIVPVGATSLYKALPKGSTEFEYVFKLLRPGTLHITIYDMENKDPNDNAYAGISLGKILAPHAVKAPEGWWKNGSNPEAYDVGIDSTQPYKKPVSVYVKSLDPKSPEDKYKFGGMMQMCRAESFRGKRLKFTGYVKTRDVFGTANLWFRVDDENGKILAFDNMQDRPIKGTTDWKEYSVVLDVPEKATALAYGMFISGAGMAWLNDVQLIEVGSNVKSTNMENTFKLPDAPQNLDFSNGK